MTYIPFCRSQQVWNCPICQKQAPYPDLIEDALIQRILASIEDEKVVFNPDGTWTRATETVRTKTVSSTTSSSAPLSADLINLEDLASTSPPRETHPSEADSGSDSSDGDDAVGSPASSVNSVNSVNTANSDVNNTIIILDDD
eukprot:TRINITY_DN11682_c0_g1_i1.p1 TRINITY_DN11682_c0_g1~~TRINITY_DN11682_c0_g1_i1.p1  ORF type:complete len:143 (-),score=24.59 TRINITY_DN11682_c0_g1_i1:89-517(-)